MSFRLRVLVLVTLVAVVATGATVWLTLQQASRQITESANAERADTEMVARTLAEYGREHGTWEGVVSVVDRLRHRTGQRIQLVTEFGQVLVDTDTLDGRESRPVEPPPVPVDPRPQLAFPGGHSDAVLAAIVEKKIDEYRSGVLLAACLTRQGRDVVVTEGPYGVPRPRTAPAPGQGGAQGDGYDCHGRAAASDGQLRNDAQAVQQCVGAPASPGEARGGRETPDTWSSPPAAGATPPGPGIESPETGVGTASQVRDCLRQVFSQRTADVAPVAVRAYIGAAAGDEPPLSVRPVLAAAAVVALLAVTGSVLISRRVLRPVRALTSASRRLGAGDLSERVPVVGRDEIAELARSFNRMADSLQRGEERQRRLTADVAHELRTPLANVRGYLEALKDGVLSPDQELFASLYEEAVLQQRVVDDLQDLAQAEAGSLVYHWSDMDVGELLESCCAAHQAVAETAGVQVVASTVGQVHVRGDPDRLRQVLGNLLTNALRATGAGGTVSLAATRAGQTALVTVADTGTGIAAEELPHVFDRFRRADRARDRATGGSGLGLAIARQIVVDHGGDIRATSEPGVGTVFTLHLPIGVAPG